MPADEVTHGTSVGESRARSGPRHAAPRKPLLTRLNMPAGKAIALAAMPTAVLMGMGFTPTLTLARADDPTKLSLTADEYKDCVEALEAAEEGTDASATPTPTPSAEESTDSTDEDTSTDEGEDTSAGDDSADDSNSSGDSASDDTATDDSASSDSGSDDKDGSASDESSTDDSDKSATDTAGSGEAPSADTSETDGGGNVLEDIGTAIEDLFTPDDKETETTPSASTSPSPSPSPSDDASGSDEGKKDDTGSDAGKDAQDTAGDASDKVEDAAKDVTDTAGDTDKAAEDATDDATDDATATPSPSPSESTDAEGCPVATDDESGVEKGIPPLPNDPWYLNASSLLLKGADYKGVVKVKTADGSVKEVLKYVISDGTDIGDLHQTVEDKQAGVTYHVQAGKGTTSTIREGKTVMYTESISGNLLGLIPVTFDPKHPPPLNIPLIYFTKVKVVQAGQFGGTLTVPGMHQFMTD
ncbi:hypothetical protein PV755_38480 [Streptomyces caniscabiei]|uniref:Membrane-bound hydrophilic protein n=1 Tax=Streptomyces caniscabiei TaxID=2746961 RepID=A0A927QGZ1_9ACTN|nr:hypothetical protein [Streptomyces caniscabiei]MBD9726703.1 hypothetical protein [Streptomyces caniscabiei]MDX3514734.1 hypothetical protein [Streptomyces caniscabiei]MDX3723707.1 hypothetical protein [Streptomyces caniscabiei]WEO24069.1 hypothetical protein IHE65_13250 [Streptomyces caniscabiei]